MQNLNPKNIEEIKLPSRISTSTIIFAVMMMGFEAWFIYLKDWIQASLYAVVVTIYIARAIWVYRSNGRAIKLIKLLKSFNNSLKEINNTPVLREEGKSVIFTFLTPSKKLLRELEKFKNE